MTTYNTTPMLAIKNVSVTYNQYGSVVHALNHVTIPLIQAGSWTFVTGSNGSGKSTLFKAITNSADLAGGVVEIEGKDVKIIGAKKLAVMMFLINQNPANATVDELTVWENIVFATYDKTKAEITEALTKIQLLSHRNHLVKNLSGGQRHLLALQIAGLRNVKLLLLDEPFSSLDPENQIWALELVSEMHQSGTTVLFITHDEALLAKTKDRNFQMIHFNKGIITSL